MSFNRIEELEKVREEKGIIDRQLYKSLRRVLWAEDKLSPYDILGRMNLKEEAKAIHTSYRERLISLREREYRLMTKKELESRSKSFKVMRLVLTFEFRVYEGTSPVRLRSST